MSRRGCCWVVLEGVLIAFHLIMLKVIFVEHRTMATVAVVGVCLSALMLVGAGMLRLLERGGFLRHQPKRAVSRAELYTTFGLWAVCFVAGEVGDCLAFIWDAPVPQKAVLTQGAMAIMLVVGAAAVLGQSILKQQLIGVSLALLATVGMAVFAYDSVTELHGSSSWAAVVLVTAFIQTCKHICGRRAVLLAGHAKTMGTVAGASLVLFLLLGLLTWDSSALSGDLWLKSLILSSTAPFIATARQLAFEEEVHPALHDTVRCSIMLLPPLLLGSRLFSDSPDLSLPEAGLVVMLIAASSWLIARGR